MRIDSFRGVSSVQLIVMLLMTSFCMKKVKHEMEGEMEGIYFLIIWIGGALLHTLYDLKVKPSLIDA